MTIALDATYSLDRRPTGVGVYSREMLWGLAGAHPEERFRFCYRPHRLRASLRDPLPPNCRRALLHGLWPPAGELFHGLNQRLPRRRPRRAVTTFHDLFVLTAEYSTPEFRSRFAAQARHAAENSDLIISVSAFTARQVEGLLGVPPARIRVVHHGVRPMVLPETAREKIVLHVGAIQKRKNVERLVTAFEMLPQEWRLVLAGSYGYGAAAILERIGKSPACRRILVADYVAAPTLADWYARSSIFAFPSLDEGFGMPVLEAMAAGLPVVASNRAAIPEVAGDAAVLIDPEDTCALAGELRRLIEDEVARSALSAKGRSRAAQFTWTKAVESTWRAYQEIVR
ncbi:MAG: glycosyltransferase family 4 protein [Bryobacteraceae bacterium]